jgi:mRNA interferase RelE/StbE
MQYEVEYKPKAWRDLDGFRTKDAVRIHLKIDKMRKALAGDVKRLSNFSPSYRLRVGDYRVLFELEGNKIIIYRVKHRRDAYDSR